MINYTHVPSPCYVLNEALLRKNLELLRHVQQEAGIEIILALKGFSMYAAFPLVKQYLAGATASSLHEARLIFEEMNCKAHVYSPAYLEQEFEEMCRYTSHLTFNSWQQFARYKHRATAKGISCGIRVNPQYSEVETDMYNPCVPGSRLGVVRATFPNVLPKEIEGLHFHTLCENDSYTLERTLEAVEQHFGDLLHQVRWLNMGGGHLITREGYDIDHLINLLKKFKKHYPHLQITLEPGSAIAWQTGVLTSTIEDIVDAQGIEVAILNMSFAAHLPDTLEMPYKPRITGAYHNPVEGKPTYRFGGMTCLAGDFMGDYSFDEPLQIGQQIIFEDMIHYTMVKTTTFNGVGLPSIGIWQENQTFKLLKAFGFESFKDRL